MKKLKAQRSFAGQAGSAIWRRKILAAYRNRKWEYIEEDIPVRIMAIKEGYAMVRRKGAMPVVVPVKEMLPNSEPEEERNK